MRKLKKWYRNLICRIYYRLGMKDKAILKKHYRKEGDKVFKIVLLLTIVNVLMYTITL